KARSRAAHTLKGAALGVGALAVAAAAEEMEKVDEDPIEVIGSLARLSARVAEARLALTDLIA
ncbi:MAG: Hpt domain-containing protein, partial [Hyphomicrobium sp.]|nr:Hpt domain-containing protein [Hyphomicrobium sp.]